MLFEDAGDVKATRFVSELGAFPPRKASGRIAPFSPLVYTWASYERPNHSEDDSELWS